MGLTYTAAIQRDQRLSAAAARRWDVGHLLVAGASAICVLAIAMAALGRVRTLDAGTGAAPILLEPGMRVEALAPAFDRVFPSAEERRIAALSVVRFLDARFAAGQPLENVAALLAARRPGPAGADAAPLLSPAVLADLKPGVAVRTTDDYTAAVVQWAAVYFAGFYALLLFWQLRGGGDRVLLAAAHLLTGLGFALLLSRGDPLRDTLLVGRYTQGVAVGLSLAALLSWAAVAVPWLTRFVYLPLGAAMTLSLLLLAFGDGPGTSGAKVNLGPVQPIEAIRLLLALFLAAFFARHWELLRQTRATGFRGRTLPAWLRLPALDYVIPVGAGVTAAVGLFFLQRDLGPALLLACSFLSLYGLARGRWPMACLGVATLGAGLHLAYRWDLSRTLAGRVAMWRSPWDNGAPGGDQLSQSLWALATGGVSGTGLGLGDTRFIPAGHTDLILAAAGEELGFVGLLAIAAVFGALAWRGLRIAAAAGDDHGFFLATTLTLFLTVPVMVMAAGILGVLPLTGVVTPFLSYGGSAMAANFAALGLLSGLARPQPGGSSHAAIEPFEQPLRRLSGMLSVAAAALVLVLATVQVVRADDYAVRPHLGRQGDGVRRYQYNPRVLAALRELPRGTVFDRTGLVLATSDAGSAGAAAAAYRKVGIDVPRACLEPGARCYPLGGEAFHVLGDADGRTNWSATNTAYVERDEEAALRGFDDHATSVAGHDDAGRRVTRLRRDYREVLPLLRHRHDREHPEARALRERARDLRLTLDARLQHDVASALAAHARRSGAGRAAAVVLDADTGKILALASHPWPSLPFDDAAAAAGDGAAADSLFDRARFGLYPPGSAFKLITATAALRRDLRLAQARFTCDQLSDGRVGVRIPGGRPVRDDVLDRHAHGSIDLRQGLVHSCNAYFAQLAVRLGPDALLDTAARLGVSVAASPTPAHLRATLPQAGYGQGETLATPLRMARVAAAIGSNGILRDTMMFERATPPHRDEVLLTPAAAGLLAGYLREAVLNGTGRTLRAHPARIAGKTGTAQVADGASHSWFVGFAPHGAATHRVAFAVIVENAGYGGQAAASLAGSIVTSAASRGLVR